MTTFLLWISWTTLIRTVTWWRKSRSSKKVTNQTRKKNGGRTMMMRKNIQRCLSNQAKSQGRRRNDLVLYNHCGQFKPLPFFPQSKQPSLHHHLINQWYQLLLIHCQSKGSSLHPKSTPSTSCLQNHLHCSSSGSKPCQSHSTLFWAWRRRWRWDRWTWSRRKMN